MSMDKQPTKTSRLTSFFGWTLLFALAWGVSLLLTALLRRIWPTAPERVTDMLPAMLVVSIGFIGGSFFRHLITERRSGQRVDGSLVRLTIISTLLSFFILFGFFLLFDWLDAITHGGLIIFGLYIMAGLFLFIAVAGLLLYLPYAYVWGPLRRLEYDLALRRAEQVEHWLKGTSLKALALLQTGRSADAQTILQTLNQASRVRSFLLLDTNRAWIKELYGYTLLEQEHYTQAYEILSFSLAANPSDSDRAAGAAEALLRGGNLPNEALKLTTQAMKKKRFVLLNRLFQHYTTPELRATHAWALAVNGFCVEARAELERADQEVRREGRLAQTSVAYRTGCALRACGDEFAAHAAYSRSAILDPLGRYGRTAQRMRVS